MPGTKQEATTKAIKTDATHKPAEIPDVMVTVCMELGRTEETLDRLLEMDEHSIIELDRLVGESIDIRLNGKQFAKGDVVTVGESFGVRVTEILDSGADEK